MATFTQDENGNLKNEKGEKIMIPRRNKLYCMIPAEKILYDAIQEIEKLPGHQKLTEAQNLVEKASTLVSDFVDGLFDAQTT